MYASRPKLDDIEGLHPHLDETNLAFSTDPLREPDVLVAYGRIRHGTARHRRVRMSKWRYRVTPLDQSAYERVDDPLDAPIQTRGNGEVRIGRQGDVQGCGCRRGHNDRCRASCTRREAFQPTRRRAASKARLPRNFRLAPPNDAAFASAERIRSGALG
jgi:hypothetical protein